MSVAALQPRGFGTIERMKSDEVGDTMDRLAEEIVRPVGFV